MSDEPDRSGAAGDGSETGEVEATGGRGQTALVTRPVTRPQRPTGKRSRQRAAAADENGGGVDVVSTATELSESGLDTETKKIKKLGKAKKAKRAKTKAEGPFRNALIPIIYVYNYLKQVTAELRKVIWPNRKQMITYTSVVLAFLVFMVALIAGSDFGFAKLVLLMFGGD
ncbi:MAG: preprotein translocase subunit SecE [Mycobacterium sp.]